MASGSQDKSLETARLLLEETSPAGAEADLPSGFYDAFVLRGIRVAQALQPGTLLCHFTVPSRLLNSGGFLHGGATASLVDLVASAAFTTAGLRTRGSPLEMNISYLDAAFADVSFLCCPLFTITTAGSLQKKKGDDHNTGREPLILGLEEIDIEAKVLRAGKAVGVAVVELKKKSGKIIAQARYSKYLGAASSKL
nr:acyl-coenzyme A thioesterase 13-like isoform X2 [Setaria viridis]